MSGTAAGTHIMHEMAIRVPYADTDQMGFVYYANYLVYFERGRTEWLRNRGLAYRDLEERGIYLPVMECSCTYRSPSRYDEILTVRTTVEETGRASITFAYRITCGDRDIASGRTKHPFVNRDFKPVRIPEDVGALLRSNAAI